MTNGVDVHIESAETAQTVTSAESKSRINPSVSAVLLLIIVAGAFLRFWAIGWSLPDQRHPFATYHPDELVDFSALQQSDIAHGKLDIGFYNYGTLCFYIADLAQTIGHGYGAIPNTPAAKLNGASPLEAAQAQLEEVRGGYLAARITTALMGTLTIPVIFFLGRRLYGNRSGLAAAGLYAILPLAVVHAHFFTVDVGATLFVALALLWAAKLLEKQDAKTAIAAGLFCGLAAAAKYSTALVFAAPLLSLLVLRDKQKRFPLQAVALSIAGILVGFLIACPGPLLNWNNFWNGLPNYPESGVRYELLVHPRLGHGLLFVNTGPGWVYHLLVSLRYGLGIPALLLVLAGIFGMAALRTRQDRLILLYLLVAYGITGLSSVRFARYMIPLYPAMCLGVGRLLCADFAARFKTAKAAVPALLGVCALLTAGYTFSLVHVMALPDARDVAADTLEKEAAQGASVAFAKTPWYFSPPLSPWFGQLAAPSRRKCTESTRYKFLLPAEGTEFDISVLNPAPDFLVLSSAETMNEERLGLPAVHRFMKAIPADMQTKKIAPPAIFDMAFSGATIPDDLGYILPQITLYSRK